MQLRRLFFFRSVKTVTLFTIGELLTYNGLRGIGMIRLCHSIMKQVFDKKFTDMISVLALKSVTILKETNLEWLNCHLLKTIYT